MYGYIYKTTNLVTGKIYIGQKKSKKFLGKKYLGSGALLIKALKKYGKDNFTVELLEEIDSKTLLNEREVYWIDYYHARNREVGYNITSGGTGGDTISCLDEAELLKCRKKMSKSQKNRWKNTSDFERKQLAEKLSKALKGKYFLDAATKEKVRQKLIGRKQSKSEREKRSKSLKEWHKNHKEKDKETGKKISKAKKGNVKITQEQKLKISNTLKEYFKANKPYITGKHHTEETIKKLSEIHSGRVHITKDGIDKCVIKSCADNYLRDGWKLGRSKGLKSKKIMCEETQEIFDSVNDILKQCSDKTLTVEKLRYRIRNHSIICGLHYIYMDKNKN